MLRYREIVVSVRITGLTSGKSSVRKKFNTRDKTNNPLVKNNVTNY